MNTKERATVARYIKFNEMSRKQHEEELKQAPYNFNAYARLKYDEGVLVGLKMAANAGK